MKRGGRSKRGLLQLGNLLPAAICYGSDRRFSSRLRRGVAWRKCSQCGERIYERDAFLLDAPVPLPRRVGKCVVHGALNGIQMWKVAAGSWAEWVSAAI